LEDDLVDICRVLVDPDYFRKGLGKSLIKHIEKVNNKAKKIQVSTALKNKPAVELYLKNGFVKIKEIELEIGLSLISFEKNLMNN